MVASSSGGERRLAAILAADVVGYSRLMRTDEEKTIARLRFLFRQVVQPAVATWSGRVFKLMGDAVLAEFGSALDAVYCASALRDAVEAREALEPPERRIQIRIAVHLSDVVVEGSDLLGDGVNIAARLEGVGEPGDVIVSSVLAESVRHRIEFELQDLGPQRLKNIDQPIRAFRLGKALTGGQTLDVQGDALPDRPSIAVLPFQNMSTDPEQEYFADGLVEEITMALSYIRGFFVIARNSAFIYKNRAVDIREVGRHLGARYVLEGSVRRAGAKIRITGQLIDSNSGAHLWADRFEGELADVFALQDRVVESVAGAIEPSLQLAEVERIRRKPTTDYSAYDCFLRGLALFNLGKADRLREAQNFFLRATELDPSYGAAFGLAANCLNMMKSASLLAGTPAEIVAEARRLADLATERGRDDPVALRGAALALAYVGMDPETAEKLIERACALNPNSAAIWSSIGYIKNLLGQHEQALASNERALRLSPRDPRRYVILNHIAQAHLQAGRYEEAVVWARRCVTENSASAEYFRTLAAALALAGRVEEARRAMTEMRRLSPGVSLSRREYFIPAFKDQAHLARLVEAYRASGMPE